MEIDNRLVNKLKEQSGIIGKKKKEKLCKMNGQTKMKNSAN